MRNIINYFYNLFIKEYKEYNNYCIILVENKLYIFKLIKDVERLNFIYNKMITNGKKVHKILLNKNGEYITKVEEKNYILMEIIEATRLINNDFEFFYQENIKDEISEIWSKKIEYYMQEIRNIGIDKTLLVDSFNYYIGMAENAIAYYNRAMEEEGVVRYAVSHKRIKIPNYGINYYDPSNMIIDSISRDLSEYIKSKMMNDGIDIEEVIELMQKYNLNNKELKILYSRILFPSYFFDEFEKSISGDYNEEKILELIKKRKNIEKLLKQLYVQTQKNNQLFLVDWLIY